MRTSYDTAKGCPDTNHAFFSKLLGPAPSPSYNRVPQTIKRASPGIWAAERVILGAITNTDPEWNLWSGGAFAAKR